MKEIIIGPESLPSSAFFSVSGETGHRPQAYVDFTHIKGGGTIIFHSEDEQKSAAGVLGELPTQDGSDKKHFAVAVYVHDNLKHNEALAALGAAGFKKEKVSNSDYKLEEKTRQAH